MFAIMSFLLLLTGAVDKRECIAPQADIVQVYQRLELVICNKNFQSASTEQNNKSPPKRCSEGWELP